MAELRRVELFADSNMMDNSYLVDLVGSANGGFSAAVAQNPNVIANVGSTVVSL